jgi:hypothetical protein
VVSGGRSLGRARRSIALRVAALVAACCAASCATRGELAGPGDLVQLKIGAGEYRIAGPGAGSHCVRRYLGVVQLRAPSFAEAERLALARSGGTYLLHKRAYEGVEGNWLVLAWRCRYVEGTGVDFAAPDGAFREPR